MGTNKWVISVDLGGTKILAALVNKKGEIKNRVKRPTVSGKGPGIIVKDLVKCIETVIEQSKINHKEIVCISIGIPGTTNPHTGVIGSAPNLKIKNYNMKTAIQKKLPEIPVLVENDVNLAGIGIKRFENNQNMVNSLVVFLGTGIGGALILENKLYRGSNFFAGEIGHMMISDNGNILAGKKGELFEDLGSRTAIVRGIKSELRKGKKSIITDLVKGSNKIKSKALSHAVLKKDRLVTGEIKKAANIVGSVLGSVTTLLNVDSIIIGGGVTEAMPKFIVPLIKEGFAKTVLHESGKKVKIKATTLGDDAPLLGGVALAEEFIKKF